MEDRPDPDRSQVRSYYRTVSHYIEEEHLRHDHREFWTETVRRSGGGPVLELGCGTGRITEALTDGSRRVVGVDLSPEMLGRARRRLERRSNVHLVRGDMRTLRLSRLFRVVVAANDPFAHLVEDGDRSRALETVSRHLRLDAGRFVVEGYWLGRDRLERAASGRGFHRERTVEEGGSTLRIRERWRCDVETRRCTVRYEYHVEDGMVERASFRARLWSPDEMCRKLEDAGLRVRDLWGGFYRSPFDPDDATRLIAEAERA